MLGRIGLVAALALTSCGGANRNAQQAAGACEPAAYTACGCGCCGGVAQVERCVDVAAGETMQGLIDADRKVTQTANCAQAGCSMPVHYTCCQGSPTTRKDGEAEH